MKDRFGTNLLIGDRVTASGYNGGHGVIDRFGNRYVYVKLTTAAFPRDDGVTAKFDPEDLRSGWHDTPRQEDKILVGMNACIVNAIACAVDDGLLPLEQARLIVGHLTEYGHRSRFEIDSYDELVELIEPKPVPAHD